MLASKEVNARDYCREVEHIANAKCTSALYAYDGEGPAPYWFKENRG